MADKRKFSIVEPTTFNVGTSRAIKGYTIDQANEMAVRALQYWMYGQTMALADDDSVIIFVDDVLRFVEGAIHTKVWD